MGASCLEIRHGCVLPREAYLDEILPRHEVIRSADLRCCRVQENFDAGFCPQRLDGRYLGAVLHCSTQQKRAARRRETSSVEPTEGNKQGDMEGERYYGAGHPSIRQASRCVSALEPHLRSLTAETRSLKARDNPQAKSSCRPLPVRPHILEGPPVGFLACFLCFGRALRSSIRSCAP